MELLTKYYPVRGARPWLQMSLSRSEDFSHRLVSSSVCIGVVKNVLMYCIVIYVVSITFKCCFAFLARSSLKDRLNINRLFPG